MHRRGKDGASSAAAVRKCAAKLKAYGIPFNTLTAVNHANARHSLAVYRYLRDEIGSERIQFLTVVETADFKREAPGFWEWEQLRNPITPWSVDPLDYGKFLTVIFDEWFKCDYGRCFIYLFEALLGVWAGYRSSLCTMAPACGGAPALDRDGSLYCCDRFCYPVYRSEISWKRIWRN